MNIEAVNVVYCNWNFGVCLPQSRGEMVGGSSRSIITFQCVSVQICLVLDAQLPCYYVTAIVVQRYQLLVLLTLSSHMACSNLIHLYENYNYPSNNVISK